MKTSFRNTMTIIPKIDYENEVIEMEVTEKIDDAIIEHYKETINVKEKIIRDALIKLGWEPPNSERINEV